MLAHSGFVAYLSSSTRGSRHSEVAKVRPLASVVSDSLKYAYVGFTGSDLNEIRAISEHECRYCLDTAHPHIVKDDVAADCAERRIKIKVHEHIIKTMIAINENNVKGGIGSREINGDTVGAIFDK